MNQLESGILIKRHKRFLADIARSDGSLLTIHCPNTGSMTNCLFPGSRIWFSKSANPGRKYLYTWELAETPANDLICVNAAGANRIVRQAITNGLIEPLRGFESIRSEVCYCGGKCRIDLLLSNPGSNPENSTKDSRDRLCVAGRSCYIEVKSVTLLSASHGCGVGLFPDAVSERGVRHLIELQRIVRDGHRAVLMFCVQHTGISEVQPADEVDPRFGRVLREAIAGGVEVMAWGTHIAPGEMYLNRRLPVVFR